MRRTYFLYSCCVILFIALFSISVGIVWASPAPILDVTPETNGTDNLIGATNAKWQFAVTTSADILPGDVVQIIFPNISNARPFDLTNVTLTATSGIYLYTASQGTARSNMIDNPSFETATTTWTSLDSGASQIATSSTAWNGTYSVAVTSSGTDIALFSQSTTTVPSTQYTASFYARGELVSDNSSRFMLRGTSTGCSEGQVNFYNFHSTTWECQNPNSGTLYNASSLFVATSTLTTSFARKTYTFTTAGSGGQTTLIFVGGGDAAYNTESVLYDGIQLETGASATAFNLGGFNNPNEGVNLSPGSGGPARIVYGYATSTIPSGSVFSVTLGGVTNASGQLSSMSNLTFTVKAGTPEQSNQPGGTLLGGFTVTDTASVTRAGHGLFSDSNSRISPSTNAVNTAAAYTFSVTASSTIPIGGKIVVNFPSEYSLLGVTINPALNNNINASSTGPAQIAEGAFATTTSQGVNSVALTTSNAPIYPGETITVVISGLTNPSSADVYRPFFVFTTLSNNGLLDGSYSGFEQSDYSNGAPMPVDMVHIGGTNTLNVLVQKELPNGTVQNLTANERTQVMVNVGCPDKQFFVGSRWLDANSRATFTGLLDCNYVVGTQPFDKSNTTFYDTFLPPGMKNAQSIGGGTATTSLIFKVPDSAVTVTVTGGVAGEQAFIHGFSSGSESFSPVFTTTGYSTPGFNGSGIGYARLPVKSAETWNFSVESGQLGNEGNFSNGAGTVRYWPPSIPATYIPSTDTVNLGSFAYVAADKTLDVTIEKSGGGTVNNACVGVKKTGGGMFMGAQDVICSPNNGSAYRFKVPLGTVTVEVNRPGGKPESYPVAITGATNTKTITVSAPTTYVEVLVEDSAHNPINGAPVNAHGSNGFGQGMTNSVGTTTIYLSPGTYVIEGFAPAFGRITPSTATITNSSNPTVTLTVNTGSLKTITGRVTQGGNGLAGVNIGARGTGATNGGNGTQTNSEGYFTLYVPAGTYEVGGWSESSGGLPPQNVNVSSANATGVNWTTNALGTLRINVSNATNVSPLFAGAFDATSGRGNGTDAWTLDGSTKYANIRLPAGTYEIHVGSPATGEITPANSTAVIVADQTTTKTYNAAASLTLVTITGTVTNGGDPVANANVWASRINGPGFFSTQTAADGTYTLNVPDEMTYRVGVKSMGYVASQGDVSVTTSGNEVQNFSLTSASATITGTVTGTAGAAITNGWVSAKKSVNGNDVWTGGPTDANGNYSLTVDSGTWTVYADGPCYSRSTGLSAAAGSSGKNISLTAMNGCTPPTPEVRGVTAASGGQVARDNLTLDIPANALGTTNSTVSVSVSEAGLVVSSPNATPLRGSVQSISATDSSGNAITSLNNNVSLTITYDPNELPVGFDEADIQMGYFDTTTGQWEPVASTVDTDNNTITAQVNHFTDYGPILPGVPEAPTGLSATAASASSMSLSWTASSGATSYVVYRSLTDSNFTTAVASGVTTTSYTDSGLSASTRYYYKVAGVNENGEGTNSSAAYATTNAATVSASTYGNGPVGGGGSWSGVTTTYPASTSTVAVSATTGITATNATTSAEVQSANVVFTKELSFGTTSNDVRVLQERLRELGYLRTQATGYYGSATRAAVQVFQKSKNISANGRFGPLTMAAMNAISAGVNVTASATATEAQGAVAFKKDLQVGMKSDDVVALQTKLKALGYFDYPEITGYFGAATKKAVQAFQRASGITPVSGFVGPLTRAELNVR